MSIFRDYSTKIIVVGLSVLLCTCSSEDSVPTDDDDQDGILNENDFFPQDATRWAKTNINISDFNGTNGRTVYSPYTIISDAISSGDINGDGFDDLIVGNSVASPFCCRISPGHAYVIFGDENGLPEDIGSSSLDGTNGFELTYEADNTGIGQSVSAGDINGDGIDDLIIGSSSPNWTFTIPKIYVVFGSTDPWTANIDLKILDGSDGFVINGIHEEYYTGPHVNSGDVNGDGYDDVIIGSPAAKMGSSEYNDDYIGAVYIVFGNNRNWPSAIELSSLDRNNGFTLEGADLGDFIGISLSAGDVNDDGFDDVVIGSGYSRSLNTSVVYVIFGTDGDWPTPIEPAVFDGVNGFYIVGTEIVSLGRFTQIDDVNKDGIADVIIHANDYSFQENEPGYVLFGCNYNTHPCNK